MIQQMIQILNSSSERKKEIAIPLSKETFEILKLLEKEGYITIKKLEKLNNKKENTKKNNIIINKNLPWKIKQISKSSRKIYLNYNNITQLYKYGLGLSIFKTSPSNHKGPKSNNFPKGKGSKFLSDKDCIWQKFGGEWIIKIF